MNAQSQPQKRPWVLYAIVLGTALPVLAAYLFHYYASVWQPGSQTVNRGVLLSPPLNIQNFKLLDRAGQPFFKEEFPGKWLILQIASDECGEPCQVRRHELRQVHVALGKEMTRVNRLLVQGREDRNFVDDQQTKENEPPLRVAYGDLLEIRHHLAQIDALRSGEVSELVFLVDPLGNIMMYYTPTHRGKDLLKDLQKLLKASQIG